MITGDSENFGQCAGCNPSFPHDRISQQQGFSLLEIMIALFIIGSVLTVIIQTVNYHSDVSYENAVTTFMYQIAKEKLAEMESHPMDSEGGLEGTDFFFVTTARPVEGTGMMEIRSVISGDGREVALGELIVRK